MDINGDGGNQRSSQDVLKGTRTARQVIQDMKSELEIKKMMKEITDKDIGELEKRIAHLTADEDRDEDDHCRVSTNSQSALISIPAERKDRPSTSAPLATQLQKDLEKIFSSSGSQLQPWSTYRSNYVLSTSQPQYRLSTSQPQSSQSQSHPLSPSLLLPPVSACTSSSTTSELEKKLDQQYESLFEKTLQQEFETTEVVLVKTYWKSKVNKLEQKLKIQEMLMPNSEQMTEKVKKEMNEMRKDRDNCLEKINHLNDALEKKIKANRNLVEQVNNLDTKHTAEYSKFQKTNEAKNNKIMSLERTIADQAARIKELQQMEHLSHKNMKLLKKEHQDIIHRKDSELRNSKLREEQSLAEIEDYKEQLKSRKAELDETLMNYLKSIDENCKNFEENQELLRKNEELLEQNKELFEEKKKLLKELEQSTELNTLLKKKLLEERKNNMKKPENGE